MARSWSLSAVQPDGRRSPPWHCQVIHVEAVDDAVVFDLIALERCPSDPLGCPRDTPFSLHVGRGPDRDAADQRLDVWSATADIITIIGGATDNGEAWICLSSRGQHLLLQA